MQYRFSFPVTAYVKENGFLGIISYNEEDDSLFITSKSDPTSQYSGWLKNIINEKIDTALIEEIKEYIKENNVSFVFECIDTKNDPHIIDYEENQLFLLDIIYNDINYHKFGYEKLCDIAKRFNLIAKEKAYVIESWQEFYDWYYEVTNEDYKYNNKNIEGFVLEDSKGYMTKLKLHYYNFWKFMRSISHEAIRKGYIERKKTSALTSALANQYYGWVKTLYNEENKELIPRDICSLRRLFFKTETGKIYKD